MSFMSDDTNDLNDEEQVSVAIERFIAMWEEATKLGVREDVIGMIALSATANNLVKIFGQESATGLLQRTLDNVKAGQFDIEDEGSPVAN